MSRKPTLGVDAIKNAKKLLQTKKPDYNTDDLWIATIQGGEECLRSSPTDQPAPADPEEEPATPPAAPSGEHAYPVTTPLD